MSGLRVLPDFVKGFVDYTDNLPSPEIFRRWAAISAIAGALERKVHVRTMGMELYPNLYTVLVAPPGIGKTVVTAIVEQLWRDLTDHHVAPKSLTKASLIDALNDAKRTKTVIQENSIYLNFNSLLVNSGELGVLLPSYDPDFMNVLTDIYDCRQYEERRRGKDLHIIIKNPQLNILAACTPSYLNSMLPEGAWDQGFLSRTLLIYSGQHNLRDIFSEAEGANQEVYSRLKNDLKDIGNLVGTFGFTPEARNAISAWHMAGGPPAPDHPKLTNYLTRRTLHLVKLCMVACASAGNTRIISLPDYQTALNWLMEAESQMPEIFRALGNKGDSAVMEEAWHFVYKAYMLGSQEPVAAHRLISFVSERVPGHAVLRIIELMEKGHTIQGQIHPKTGMPAWKPLQKSY